MIVWIGNIFMHSNISNSFGSSLMSVKGYAMSIILTTAISWPIGILIDMMPQMEACVALPFLVFVASFIIMSCPQLTSPNLMILVMYLVVATNVREDISQLEPWGWVITYQIGLVVAVIVNIFPSLKLSLAMTHDHMSRLEKDLSMLLMQCKAYADNTATVPGISRAASATIEMLSDRIIKTTKGLKSNLGSAKIELAWQCKSYAADDLEEWVSQAENLLSPIKSLRNALTQRVLGEDLGLKSPALSQVKLIIKEEIGKSRDRMVDAMIAAVAVCHAWADPHSHRHVLPDVEDELRASVESCRRSFNRAIRKSAKLLGNDSRANVPIFAHLTRRMTAFNAMFDFAESLLLYLEHHRWEKEELLVVQSKRSWSSSFYGTIFSILDSIQKEWLWHKPEKFRVALKTSVGMAIASLFVSIDYLWNISAPFGVWPGLTIASVNLGNTGSSFHKAQDRLFGTLLAAAYALLVSDLFPGNKDIVKIPAIALFTFVLIYLRNAEHAYKFTYAATSIGSMLYGSVKNNFNIAGYIPKRIELIFVGVVIFSFVELLLFPRSSRKMVENLGFEIFFSVRDFLHQAAVCTHRMELFIRKSKDIESYDTSLFEGNDIFQLQKLDELQRKLKSKCSKLKIELESGIDEPHIGLSIKLNASAFRALVNSLSDCENQTFLLLKAFKSLAIWIQDERHPIRNIQWTSDYIDFIQQTLLQLDSSCEWLKSAFPDSRLRPQRGNAVRAVAAAASFRSLDDVRLEIISKCSVMYSQYIHKAGLSSSDPVAVMTIGITTTYILELCRHLQKAGSNVESITYEFPASSPALTNMKQGTMT